MKKHILLFLLLIPIVSQASGLQVSQPILYIEGEDTYTLLHVSWENAWKTPVNNDGVWLFFKSITQAGYHHISVSEVGHKLVAVFSSGQLELGFKPAEDDSGIFIFPTTEFNGNISVTLKISLAPKSFAGIRTRGAEFVAYGIEMVSIPQGSFAVGSTDTKALAYGAFYQPVGAGEYGGVVNIESEAQTLTIATHGELYYQAKEGYEGDQAGTIPSTFPKGVAPFLVMKYEPTEGQYVDFLNCLPANQVDKRAIFRENAYYKQGGSISEKEGRYTTPYPNKPCKFMGWADAMAYADWAALRPMTEFEFSKACRGTSTPIHREFPWGTDSKEQVQRFPNPNGELMMLNGWDESNMEDGHKKYFGASYYWVMDLAGSLWERVVSVGHEKGRNFLGSHGDGFLSAEGDATNTDWPTGEEAAGGVGFRGGGFYGYDREYHEYNPFSPIAYRPYGGWHGIMRSHSYGARFVRSIQ